MAEALSEQPPLVEHHRDERSSSYRGRFRVAYAALAVVVAVAAGALALVVSRGGPGPAEAWSVWRPDARESLDRAGEIAAHLAPRYRLQGGQQLVGVQANGPTLQNDPQDVPVGAVAVRGGITGQDIQVDSTDGAVFFVLCGLGENCALASGEPSPERATLLRREALELALYTFKYADADSVVAFLPPATLPDSEEKVNWALYFERADFERQLASPLSATLPARERSTPSSMTERERAAIERLTSPRAYATTFTASPDGGAVLVLDPLINAQ